MSNKKQKKNQSLEKKAFWTIIFSAVVLFLLITPFELLMHGYTIMTNYKRESRLDLAYAVSLIDQEYLDNLYAKTKEIYDSTTEEERHHQFEDSYREKFVQLVDDEFLNYRRILVKCREEKKLVNVYLIFIDKEHDRFVYVIDGDRDDYAYLPGQWLSDENGEIEDLDRIEQIESSNWLLSITYGDLYGFTGTNYYDIHDSEGNWIGYGVIDFDVNDFFNKLFDFLKIYIPFLIIIVTFGAIRISKRLRNSILIPIDNMASTARVYTRRDKVNQTASTNYFGALNISTGDELEELWKSMVDMETDISETMSRIRQVTEEKLELKNKQDRISNELSIATRIQEGILPSTFPPFPERKEFDIYASMKPALEVGGDFYDFFLIDEDHLGLVMADVSGKGISASLFMVIAKTMIQNETMKIRGLHPSEVLKEVNKRLLEGNDAEMFVTVWLGILTISTGEINYVDAGHEYPAVCRGGKRFELFKDVHGMPVAAMETTKFREDVMYLMPGDILYLYTDGVTDANNPDKERFETDRMLEALNIEPNGTLKEINDNVRSRINEFMAEEPQFDDTTMMVVRYYGPQNKDSEEEKEG